MNSTRLQFARTMGPRARIGLRALGRRPNIAASGFNLVRSMRPNGMGIYAGVVECVLKSMSDSVQTLQVEEELGLTSIPSVLNPVTISAVTPGHIAFAELQYASAFLKSQASIGIFMWDVDVIPRRLRVGFRLLDELWTASTMGAEYLRRVTSIPVHYFPAPITPPRQGPTGIVRKHFDIGDSFLVGYQFDIGSSANRKNPRAAIEIYKAAFPRPQSDSRLILKCTRADTRSPEWKDLEHAKGSRDDIILVNEFWPQDLVDSFYRDLDCYLSPHRSEGYGLTVAQALANGVHVIATAYGGPMDFINPSLSDTIPYRLINIGKDPIYPVNARWAEPNFDAGADLLRRAFVEREQTRHRAVQAQREVLKKFTIDSSVEWIKNRLV